MSPSLDAGVLDFLDGPCLVGEEPTPEEIEDAAFLVGTLDETDPIPLEDQPADEDLPEPPAWWFDQHHHVAGHEDGDYSWLFEREELTSPPPREEVDDTPGQDGPLGASLVGYAVSSSPSYLGVRSLRVPGTDVYLPVRGDVGPLLIGAALEWHKYLEHLRRGWCWGYAYRAVTGGGGYSFHAAAIAVDLNAPLHPYGVSSYRNFSSGELAVLRAIASKYGLRSGAFYNGTPDAMHLEIIIPRYDALARLKRLQSSGTWGTRVPPVRATIDLSNMRYAAEHDRDRRASNPSHPYGTKIVERALVREGLLSPDYIDGYWGTATRYAWLRWERKLGWQEPDRKVGKAGLVALGKRNGFRVSD